MKVTASQSLCEFT